MEYNLGQLQMADVCYMELDEDPMAMDDEQARESLDENIMALDAYGSDEWAGHPPTYENPQHMDLT